MSVADDAVRLVGGVTQTQDEHEGRRLRCPAPSYHPLFLPFPPV